MHGVAMVLGLIGVAGCGRFGFASIDDGLVDDIDGSSVDGRPASGDTDSDGLTDDVDNCVAIGNPDQNDEDADGRGDVCDPCPIDADDTDSDGDGVGDSCDPNPGTTGDVMVRFDGFGAVDNLDDYVTFGDGDWSIDVPGQVHYVATSMNPGGLVTLVDDSPPLTITSRIHLVTAEDGNTTMSVVDGVDIGPRDGEKCGLGALNGGSPTLGTGTFENNSSIAEIHAAWTGSVSPGATYTLVLRHAGTELACAGTDGNATASVSQIAERDAGRYGVRLRRVVADIDFLMAVKSP